MGSDIVHVVRVNYSHRAHPHECATLKPDLLVELEYITAQLSRDFLRRQYKWISRKKLGLLLLYGTDRRKLTAGEAIDVPFEPVALNENDHRFRQFARLCGESCSGPRNWLGRTCASLCRCRSNIREAFDEGDSLNLGSAVATFVFPFALARAVLGAAHLGQWYLAPAGVAHVMYDRVDLFEARRSVLCLHPALGWGWYASVIGQSGIAMRWLTKAEATVLVAAWCSPLETPSPEHLGAWFSSHAGTRGHL